MVTHIPSHIYTTQLSTSTPDPVQKSSFHVLPSRTTMSTKEKITRNDKAAWMDKYNLCGWFARDSHGSPVKKKCPPPVATKPQVHTEEYTSAMMDMNTKHTRTNYYKDKMFSKIV